MLIHPHCVAWKTPTIAGLILAALLNSCASPPPPPPNPAPPAGKLSEKAKQEQQQAILKIRNQTIKQLYKLKLSAQAEIEASVGYGVFEINGLNAVLAESHGRGVVVDKRAGLLTCNWRAPMSGPAQRSSHTDRCWCFAIRSECSNLSLPVRRLTPPRCQHQGLQVGRKGRVRTGGLGRSLFPGSI